VKAVAKVGARVKVKAENGREAFVEAVTVDQNVSLVAAALPVGTILLLKR